jgi:ribosome maturation factor RimP
MSRDEISKRVNEIAARAAGDNSVELVHVDLLGSERNPVVRIYIDKPGGVTVDDCTSVSNQTGEVLDEEDIIADSYVLEVSSPGLERELYSLADFVKFTGCLAKVKLRAPRNGQRNFRGRIKAVDGGEIVFDDKVAGEVRFQYEEAAKANLEIDLEEELKRK